MAKKNYLNKLPQLGGTAVMTLAMAAALATPASATEVEGTPVDAAPVDTTPVVEAAPVVEATPAPAVVEPAQVPVVNAEVSSSNTEVASDNTAVADNNQTVVQENTSAAENNETATGGELSAPEMPAIPEAPKAPEVPETDGLPTDQQNELVGEYNGEVGEYNDQVDDYNDAAEDYNTKVDEYNGAAAAYDQQAQGEYQEYLGEKKAYEDAYQDYLEEEERRKQEHEAQENLNAANHKLEQDRLVQEDQAKKTQAEQDHAKAEAQAKADHEKNELEAAKKAHDEAEKQRVDKLNADEQQRVAGLNATEQQKAAELNAIEREKVAADAQKMQDELNNYNADKKTYEDAVAKEETVYEEVLDYNKGIEEKNGNIETANKALENDVDAEAVENIDAVGDINKNVNVDAGVLEILNGYKDLADQESKLLETAAALDADERRNSALGSDEYAAYVAEVEAYNIAVDTHNQNVQAYNNAVTAYNTAVQDFNDKQEASTESSTGNGYAEGDADWGNIQITGKDWYGNEYTKTLGHIHVKYQAAASQDKTIGSDGKPSYSESVTGYEVVGVYPNQERAKKNPNNYGVTYDNDGPGGNHAAGVENMYKDETYDEFGANTFGGSVAIQPDKGTVSFYVTLKDEDGNIHDITVNLNDASTYAEGSYYKAETGIDKQGNLIFTDTLSYYHDSNGNPLEREKIGGEWYYNISGKSVFVISALTCEGTSPNGSGTKINIGNISGLDLVLNLQTMIEVHQSQNAKKLTYTGFELGKTAYADKREHKTYEELKGEFSYDPYDPQWYEPVTYTPTVYTPVEFDAENFTPTEYKEKPFVYEDYQPTEYQRKKYEPRDYTGPADPGHKDAPTETQKLNHVDKMQKLDELLYFVEETPPAPVPIVLDDEYPIPDPTPVVVRKVALKNKMIIEDEKIPLAKAPKTGDLSGIWAVISGLSLGGMTMLNRKRKEEE